MSALLDPPLTCARGAPARPAVANFRPTLRTNPLSAGNSRGRTEYFRIR